jgi:hypothetical protein
MTATRPDQMELEILSGWTLPTQVDDFLDWLDDSGLAEDTTDAIAKFMTLPAAKEMPESLKSDLRQKGYL